MSNPTMLDAPTHYDTGADRSQATKRSYRFYLDQHGRRWGASVEKSTGEPCGPLEPQGWIAPLVPNPKYMSVDPVANTLEIDYEAWIRDTDEAHAYWHQLLREHAATIYGQGAVSTAIKDPQPELLDRVGPKPKQQRGPLEAALQGNRWILGLTDKKPSWAEEFFPTEEEEELAELKLSRKYPDADEEDDSTYPRWSGPKTGWQLSDGEYVSRFDGEDKDAYKQRALDAEESLQT